MVTVKRIAIASVLLAIYAYFAIVNAAPSCAPPPGAVSVPLTRVPPVLLQEVVDNLGEIAPPRGAFDRGCVVLFGQVRRLAFVWKADNRWIVAIEQGGRLYSTPIFRYELDGGERKAVLTAEVASPKAICPAASTLIASH